MVAAAAVSAEGKRGKTNIAPCSTRSVVVEVLKIAESGWQRRKRGDERIVSETRSDRGTAGRSFKSFARFPKKGAGT